MILNIIFYDIYLDNILPKIIILNVSNLCILISLLDEVIQMILFHLFNYFNQSIVEGSGQIGLLVIVLFEIGKFLDSTVMLLNYSIAVFE